VTPNIATAYPPFGYDPVASWTLSRIASGSIPNERLAAASA
jgi:hypothetical protein